MFKKEKFPVKIFIFISIVSFLLLLFILAIFKVVFLPVNYATQLDDADNKYYLNKEYTNDDPLVTSVPILKDMITGPIISNDDPSLGAKDSKVVIAEFSDFDCYFCKKQEVIIREIIDEYQYKIRLVWKDFPDIKVSSPSYQASIAGRCAFEQGKFWEYHDLLFERSNFNEDVFLELADTLNLKINIFKNCLKDNEITTYINNNILEADALEIQGVPFLYVNDQEILGEVTKEELKKIIDTELGK